MGNSKSTPSFANESEYQYQPARPTDSRSPCPALNALANHGYLPRDGKNIPPELFQRVLQVGLNFIPFLRFFLHFLGENGFELDSYEDDSSASL